MDTGIAPLSWRHRCIVGALFVLAAGLCYANTFHVPFLFDDIRNIVTNPSIRPPWSLSAILHPPKGTGIAGRPVINATLALNYAISGEAVWSYHALNLLIHVLAGLTLFAILRQTLAWNGLRERYGRFATELALACALIWTVHPLQTQSVTYIIQRCESLMGLCFLLTFHFAIQGWRAGKSGPWHLLAALAFLVGVGSKEIIVVAPLLILLYELLFVHRGIREAWRASGKLYAGLAVGCLLLALLIMAGGTQSSVRGERTFTHLQYALTQAEVIPHYLRLSLWPDALCFDYAWPIVTGMQTLPQALAILAVLAVGVWLLVQRHPAGFVLAWFFLILSPTSSIVPIPDPAFEQRMYLSLASVVVLVVFGGFEAGRLIRRRFPAIGEVPFRRAAFVLVAVLVAALGTRTYLRNQDYRSEISIWSDTIEKRPFSARARFSLGATLLKSGRPGEALNVMAAGLRLQPNNPDGHTNVGAVLAALGRHEEALVHFRKALELAPGYAYAHNDVGRTLLNLGHPAEALQFFRKSLELEPDDAEVRAFTGLALVHLGDFARAVPHLRRALKWNSSDPTNLANVHANLGLCFFSIGKWDEAVAHLEKALAITPENPGIQALLGSTLVAAKRWREAIAPLEKALAVNPRDAKVHRDMGLALLGIGEEGAAERHFQEARSLDSGDTTSPDDPEEIGAGERSVK